EAVADLVRVVHRVGLAGCDQRRREQRLAEHGEQFLRDLVVWDTQADGAARRMRHAARYLFRRFENEGERPRRGELEQAVLLVVDARVARELGQVAAQQGQMVL